MEGRDEPVDLNESAIAGAYKVMQRQLKKDKLTNRALFCTTGAAALGAMRAISEAGYAVGSDIVVCAADDDVGMCRFLIPSVTCLQDPQIQPYIQVCLDWFARGGEGWVGPMVVQPTQMPLFIGESTAATGS